jgi:hypothetical protein
VKDVPYWREKAGMSKLLAVKRKTVSSKRLITSTEPRECIGIAS